MLRLVITLLALPPGLAAQASPSDSAPPVLAALSGEWVGSGDLLGRPGVFRMEWSVSDAGFARLSFSNAWLGASQDTLPVLSSEATYLVRGSSALGVWIDNRPQQLTLSATLTDSTLVTEWTAPAERGRTEYIVRSPTVAVVRDFVLTADGEQPFGEATYRRVAPGPTR